MKCTPLPKEKFIHPQWVSEIPSDWEQKRQRRVYLILRLLGLMGPLSKYGVKEACRLFGESISRIQVGRYLDLLQGKNLVERFEVKRRRLKILRYTITDLGLIIAWNANYLSSKDLLDKFVERSPTVKLVNKIPGVKKHLIDNLDLRDFRYAFELGLIETQSATASRGVPGVDAAAIEKKEREELEKAWSGVLNAARETLELSVISSVADLITDADLEKLNSEDLACLENELQEASKLWTQEIEIRLDLAEKIWDCLERVKHLRQAKKQP